MTDFLHRPSEVVVGCFQRSVDVLFACDLVTHLDAFIANYLTGFGDFFWGVVDCHCG